LAHDRGLLLIDDLGSGCLLDTRQFGLAPEPTPRESLAAGADLTMFSGDKLLGGPQAGIVVGKKAQVDWLKRHPLARAVRIDKASLAGLAATLVHYLRNEAEEKVPVWRMIAAPTSELEARARAWQGRLGGATEVADGRSMIGGGSLPEESLPTKLLAIPQEALGQRLTLEDLAAQLRAARPAVVARIERGRLLFDPRTVLPGEEDALLQAIEDRLPRP
ncbi:MAG TPA: L-seryl-tRNA(Sec) selenium transferase, partial [Dehalococcoidia bacterium]|nr:L-seryl-tRNA(Sec) selenium transferase [Dehalococcoidia bacterium]